MNPLLFFSSLAQEVVTPARSGAPLRVIASILLLVMLCGVIYVLRNLGKVKRELVADDLMPSTRGPRNNMVLVVCAVSFVVICLLLFLVVKT
jgi:hypothetical protein